MALPPPDSYRSVYRRVVLVVLACLGFILGIAVVIALAARFAGDGNAVIAVILWSLGLGFLLFILVCLTAFRVHRWAIEAGGVKIEERPSIPFAGFPRQALVPFVEIADLREIESGMDLILELVTRNGICYRLMESRSPLAAGQPSLAAFGGQLRSAAVHGGNPLSLRQAPGFWNGPAGLGVIGVIFLLSLAVAIVVAWGLASGEMSHQARSYQYGVLVVAAPIGVGYWFYRALKRRRALMRGQQQN
ncbi:hypothetical protein FRZ61_45710 [Hypericibacter adhaerens]|uniref:Uncharacterized protein n=1 Tax=Hypericibacter adhaerens TaxID=2602016 RepID=A0A5J6N783_9PROT|nr:hypothetical protein [Hypericibacter adhaerens]QEX24630.1 hypothetical protein FRZ61_45710 [Hypericibacter adhaerens]